MIGNPIARFVLNSDTVTAPNHKNVTLSKIEPTDILPNNLKDSDTIRANRPTISSSPINNDITLSQSLLGIIHFPKTGTYSCTRLAIHHTDFACAYKIAPVATRANAILNSSSAVGAVKFLNNHGNANLIISLNQARRLDKKIIENKLNTNNDIQRGTLPRISSKNS